MHAPSRIRPLASFLFRRWGVLLALLAACLAVGLAAPHAWAWYQLRSARADLKRYHPEVARARLARCLATWPDSVEAHLLASRAARQSGDLEEADRQVRACQRLAGSSDDVALEWALLQAAGGNVLEVEEYLQRRADQDPGSAPLVWEALVEGYIRLYRILDALSCLDHWLTLDPDNLRAQELRGLAYQHGKSAHKGAEDLRRVIERDPTRDSTRWRLVLCLLDMGAYDEALPHVEHIARQKPDDPDVQVRLARCHNMVGNKEQASQVLEAVLAKHPGHALALRTRGQFALAQRQPAEAERWLRQAVEARPNDYQSNWLLFQALRQQEKADEAQAQLRRADEVKEKAERLGELTSRKLSERPLDPALHYELGMLLLRTGQEGVGVGWLLSAVSLDKDYCPAHAALADYYQEHGDPQRSAHHARLAAP